MIRISCMRPVFNPYPTINVNEPFFPFLGRLESLMMLAFLFLSSLERRNLATRGQSTLLDLPANFAGGAFAICGRSSPNCRPLVLF